jgi:hypothetical protein
MISSYPIPSKNMNIQAVIVDINNFGITPKLDKLSAAKTIAQELYKEASLDSDGKYLDEAIMVAREQIFPDDGDVPSTNNDDKRQKVLFIVTRTPSGEVAEDVKEEVLKLRQNNVKVVFVVPDEKRKKETTDIFKDKVNVIVLKDMVDSDEVNQAQNELSKGIICKPNANFQCYLLLKGTTDSLAINEKQYTRNTVSKIYEVRF